jgi:hypothetical protein
MTETKTLQTRSYPEIMKDFARQNFNLKILCSALIGLLFLMLILTLYLVKRGPEVIALDGAGEVARLETKVTDLQIQAALREYVLNRYNWTPESFNTQIKKAEFFVAPSLVGSFRKSMLEVQKFVTEKKVTQRVYPRLTIDIDMKNKKAFLVADRITEFGSLKAATELTLTLFFTVDSRLDARSAANPWGIFIVKESEGGEK